MPSIINEILKGVADDDTLSNEMNGVCALALLLEDYKVYRSKYDATLPFIDENSKGHELKEALLNVAPKNRFEMLSKYIKTLDEDSVCVPQAPVYIEGPDDSQVEEKEIDDSKNFLMKLIIYSFLVLGVLLVVVIVYTTLLGLENPGGDTFNTILNGLVEILKVLVGF